MDTAAALIFALSDVRPRAKLLSSCGNLFVRTALTPQGSITDG